MKILIFLHGTLIMHKSGRDKSRGQRVKQSARREASVLDYANYVPIGNSVQKLWTWKKQGAKIIYLSSHKNKEDVQKDKFVLKKFKFPTGKILYRKNKETYKHIAEKIIPDILIEDDCESIGGKSEMTIANVSTNIRKKIKSLVVKEFYGIGNLPDKLKRMF